jgi:hypothetical protein
MRSRRDGTFPQGEEIAMKTTSMFLTALGILAVIAAAGLFFLFSRLDRIVAAAIERYGSEATGTKAEVSSVRIRLKAGEGSIRNFSIGPPRILRGEVSIQASALPGKPINVSLPRIELKDPGGKGRGRGGEEDFREIAVPGSFGKPVPCPGRGRSV